MDIEGLLKKDNRFKKVAKKVADEFKKAGLDNEEKFRNAPILIRAWYGVSADAVVQYLEENFQNASTTARKAEKEVKEDDA